MNLFAPHQLDFYKVGHPHQYPRNTTFVLSNLTARSGSLSNVPNSTGIRFVGFQLFAKDFLMDEWDRTFFSKPKEKVLKKFQRRITIALKKTNSKKKVSIKRLSELHDLGYLPIRVKTLPEGSFVPYKVPMLTICNTLDKFYWVTNMLESVMSSELWPMINSATIYEEYVRVLYHFAKLTGADTSIIPYQIHNFSYRGMSGREAAAKTAFACLAVGSMGTDTVSALDIAEDYYNSDPDEFIAGSINATEHSVSSSNIAVFTDLIERRIEEMKSNSDILSIRDYDPECVNNRLLEVRVDWDENKIQEYAELMFIEELIVEIYPNEDISFVADTYDFFRVVTNILPVLKDTILAREGKVVVRPDSGDPVKIVTGYTTQEIEEKDGQLYFVEDNPSKFREEQKRIPISEAERKGLIECLYEIFGGSTNSLGYITLNPKIGAIYGESITLEREWNILKRLMEKGFASDNIFFGAGSFTFQFSTRDTHGMAIKATYVEVDGKPYPIFKDPKTDDGTKKSAKGLIMVTRAGGKYSFKDECSRKEEKHGCLEVVFEDGKLVKEVSLNDVIKVAEETPMEYSY